MSAASHTSRRRYCVTEQDEHLAEAVPEAEIVRYAGVTSETASPLVLTLAIFATLLASITGIAAFACFRTAFHKISGDGFIFAL
jgi:hypothetical protein